MSLKSIQDFFLFLDRFRKIERIIYVDESKRKENDAEHSYQLAMMVWYIAESEKLDMNTDKILKYALVHDLVEVYAGDSLPFTRWEQGEIDKDEKEKRAISQIKETFPEFPELTNWIEMYESKQDPESRFVYAVDKLIPTMNNMNIPGAPLWKDYDISFEQVADYCLEKTKADPTVHKLYQELVEELKEKREDFFGDKAWLD